MNEIPSEIFINGVRHFLIEERNNVFNRALVLPESGGCPVWLSNDQIGELSRDNKLMGVSNE